ncbi:hypothetical protein C1645_791044 [Glomus cerebriforme]|uniref:Uncharacterized protein n=1 Tax=Glomus cerebriforme TaxID=658196 RepID=A0A397SAX7_9GLOM|nr:hypothetical protein C1645_791044 [Glomus cerebriforme]
MVYPRCLVMIFAIVILFSNNVYSECKCYTMGRVCGWAMNDVYGNYDCIPNHIYQCNSKGSATTEDYGPCICGCTKASPNHNCNNSCYKNAKSHGH